MESRLGRLRVLILTDSGLWSLMPSLCRTKGSPLTDVEHANVVNADGDKVVNILSILPSMSVAGQKCVGVVAFDLDEFVENCLPLLYVRRSLGTPATNFNRMVDTSFLEMFWLDVEIADEPNHHMLRKFKRVFDVAVKF